jgi:hypothetical protein
MKPNTFAITVVVAMYGATMAFSQNWTLSGAPTGQTWEGVASSADGNKLFAISTSENYAISTNAGATWATYAEPQLGSMYGGWDCNASSADGNILIGINYNCVWVSTNAGFSWVSNVVAGADWLAAVALSADGTKAVAVDGDHPYGGNYFGGIYTSTNSGMTWNQTTAPIESWTGVASSADGTILAATMLNTSTIPVYISTNSGDTWAPAAFTANMYCSGIACSADGRKLVVVGGAASDPWLTDLIYTSTNCGNSWTLSNQSSVGFYWYGVASSADGATLLACANGDPAIIISTNSGATWVSNTVPYIGMAPASSADGKKLAMAFHGGSSAGGICTAQSTPSPQLNSSLANGNLALSWLVPSTNFVLQKSSGVTGANWSTVTNTPVLNFSNLQYQVIAQAASGSAFFRLATH